MPQESTPRRERKRTVQQMVIVGVIATSVGIAVGLIIPWFPPADSTQADKIDTLWDVLIIASVPIFVLVTVVVGFVTYAYIVLHNVEKAPAAGNERHVTVTGQQFAWTFAYNEGGKKFTTAQLYLPAGESVKFDVKSKDVIHDFWVPDFRMKIDAVPGITTHYRVTPKNPQGIGEHPIVCAELCGLGHAFMRSTVHVLAKPEFDKWVAKMTAAKPAGGGGGGGGAVSAADAKKIFVSGNADTGATACGSCHTLADAGTTGQTGPDLDKVLKGKDAAFIKESILDPNKVIE